MKSKKVLCWTTVPEATETDEDVAITSAKIKKEWNRSKKDHSKIKKLMDSCYAKRRSLILEDIKKIVDVVVMFPPLKNLLYVSIV